MDSRVRWGSLAIGALIAILGVGAVWRVVSGDAFGACVQGAILVAVAWPVVSRRRASNGTVDVPGPS